MNDLGRDLGMLRQEVIQSVGPGHHQRLEPRRAAAVILLQAAGIDEQSLPQVAVNRRLAFRLRQHPQAVEVVALDAAEVVLGLRINHAEHGVRVRLAVDMRDAPVVAHDADVQGVLLPARVLAGGCEGRTGRCRGTGSTHGAQKGQDQKSHGGAGLRCMVMRNARFLDHAPISPRP